MKSVFLSFILLFFVNLCFAQKYEISESEIDIKGVPRKGQQILIHLDSKEVEKAWENHLREKAGKIVSPIGLPKTQLGKNIRVLEKAQIDTISKTPMRIITKVDNTSEGALVWWTLDLGNTYVTKEATPQQYAAAEGFLISFARKVYREDMKRQVAEAEKVLKNAQSEEGRVVKQADDYKKALDKNAARKQDLEAELARNAKEKEQIENNIANNQKEQEAARLEVENMKKAVDIVKAKANSLL